jgi:hypothetical protein
MLFDDVVLFDDFPNLVKKSTRLQPLMAGEDKRWCQIRHKQEVIR